MKTLLITLSLAGFLLSACAPKPEATESEPTSTQDAAPASTSTAETVKVADLYNNSANYAGKVVRVQGNCIKFNENIMGRNWAHIDDGSVSGKDLTVTTDANVAVGTKVAMVGTIALKKDFGAGYTYEVIMENAKVE